MAHVNISDLPLAVTLTADYVITTASDADPDTFQSDLAGYVIMLLTQPTVDVSLNDLTATGLIDISTTETATIAGATYPGTTIVTDNSSASVTFNFNSGGTGMVMTPDYIETKSLSALVIECDVITTNPDNVISAHGAISMGNSVPTSSGLCTIRSNFDSSSHTCILTGRTDANFGLQSRKYYSTGVLSQQTWSDAGGNWSAKFIFNDITYRVPFHSGDSSFGFNANGLVTLKKGRYVIQVRLNGFGYSPVEGDDIVNVGLFVGDSLTPLGIKSATVYAASWTDIVVQVAFNYLTTVDVNNYNIRVSSTKLINWKYVLPGSIDQDQACWAYAQQLTGQGPL